MSAPELTEDELSDLFKSALAVMSKGGCWTSSGKIWNQSADACRALLRAYHMALEAQGLVVVPREPTSEMIEAAYKCEFDFSTKRASMFYRAMIAEAAPPHNLPEGDQP